MTNTTERSGARLAHHAVQVLAQAGERGWQVGAAWAAESAEYLDLKRLATIAASGAFADERVGYRVVCAICGERQLSPAEIAAFRESFGLEDEDAGLQPKEYWQGFVQGALEAFEMMET